MFGAGLLLILQPWWSERQQEKEQSKLLTEWDQSHDSEQRYDIAVPIPPVSSRAAPTNLAVSAPEPPAEPKPSPSPSPSPSTTVIDGQKVQGTIEIESIGLREPILEGATDETLRYGIGTVVSDRRPGETGNYVLAGHNSRTPGKHFNRIHELRKGDRIVITTADSVYRYAVTSQQIVEPDDLSVLDQAGSTTELTLITCDQIVNPKHRLIVRAILDSPKPA